MVNTDSVVGKPGALNPASALYSLLGFAQAVTTSPCLCFFICEMGGI